MNTGYGSQFNERTWLTWWVKVRIIVITFLLGIGLAIIRLTTNNISQFAFVSVIVLWYTISVFYALLLSIWDDSRMQSRLQILADLAFVTAIVYLAGGSDTPFNFLYPLIIIVASIMLSRAWTYLVAALSFILFGATLELAYFDVIRSYATTRPDPKLLQAIIFINLFAFMAVAYLSSSLTTKLRQVDVQLQDKSGALEKLEALHENIINLHARRRDHHRPGRAGHAAQRPRAGAARAPRPRGRRAQPVSRLFLDRLPDVAFLLAIHGEVRSLTPTGQEKTFSITASPLTVPERGTLGYVYAFSDLTEIRRLEREVRMRDRLAAVGRMAAGIAHEIRNRSPPSPARSSCSPRSPPSTTSSAPWWRSSPANRSGSTPSSPTSSPTRARRSWSSPASTWRPCSRTPSPCWRTGRERLRSRSSAALRPL